MRRVLIALGVLAAGLAGAIAWKIRAQERAKRGPPTGSAVVESEGVDLSARLSARVSRVLIEEGGSVEARELLFELECDEPRARLAEVEARLSAARAQAEAGRAQARAATRQSQAARESIGAAAAQMEALETQQAAAEREAERVERMGEHAALARRDQVRSAATGLEAQAQAARASRAASARQAGAASAQANAAASQALAADRSVEALEALVQSAQIVVDECRIEAPRRGIVERLYYEPGELVTPGAVVARVIDPDVMTATFYVSNVDVDQAEVGMPAKLTADAIEGRVFDARVHRVGLEAEFTPRNIQTRSDRDRLVYPVEVRIPNREHLLRPGMNVTVVLPTQPGHAAQ